MYKLKQINLSALDENLGVSMYEELTQTVAEWKLVMHIPINSRFSSVPRSRSFISVDSLKE